MTPILIVLNAGSSSLKFQVFEIADGAEPAVIFTGLFEGLGGAAHFVVKNADGRMLDDMTWSSGDRFGHEGALAHLVSWLKQNQGNSKLVAFGHRVVHGGGAYSSPVLVDDAVIQSLEELVPLAPLHQPHNLEPIKIARRRIPHVPQVACFDTAFHQTQPELATMLALPRDIRERGVKRYGFHGLSYDYISSVLGRYDRKLAEGRVIVAHLGNGASLCALNRGNSVATTMGFSALEGLPMGTRSGALDPGVIFYMLREMQLSPKAAEDILYKKSGLLGISGISNDMRVLRAKAAAEPDARRAIDMFVYRITREIGSLAAALGGLDGLVFTAGIGENDAATRAEVISRLSWLGFSIDAQANARGGPQISAGSGPGAWVIPTNEELVIARHTQRVLRHLPN
ncbi:MAG: acetate/propionate family kinase [Pseudomonadota bacterium]